MSGSTAALFPRELLAAAGLVRPSPEEGGLPFSAGRHRSPRRGDSAEFQDFRAYTPGDDLRRLDWNIYRRTRKLLIRQYRDFPQRKHWIVLDDSASIRCRASRMELVWRLGALLGGSLLTGGDSVTLQAGAGSRRVALTPGGGSAAALIRELERAVRRAAPGPAPAYRFPDGYHVWVVSDFMDPLGLDHLEVSLRRSRGFTPVRIFEPEELAPSPETEMRLVDVESGAEVSVGPDAALLRGYRERLARFERLLEIPARRAGTRVYAFDASRNVPELIRAYARAFAPEEVGE